MFATLEDYERMHGKVDAEPVTAQLERATALIRSECNQHISRATSTVKVNGTWERELVLPEWPVVSVESITVDGRAVALAAVEVTTRSIRWAGGHRHRYGARGGFPANWGGPDAVVEVTYAHGFDPVPDAVKWLCVDLAAAEVSRPVGVRSESEQLEDYQSQVTYDTRGETTAGAMAAVVRRYGR